MSPASSRIPVLALLLAVAFVLPSQARADLDCAACGKSITGRYIEEKGKAYHPDCYEQYRAPHCDVCGKPILGPRIEMDGENYHEDCYREAKQPRCTVCGRPIEGRYLVEGGRSYHPRCHRTRSPRCAICGEALEGSYLADGWGNPFHARHGEDLICPFCNRVMAVSTTHGSFISSANGIRICSLCARRAVSREGQAGEALERVRRQLEGFFPVPEGSFTWRLVDRPHLISLLPSGQIVGNELGITLGERTRMGGEVQRRIQIVLLSGIPDWLFEAVAAHELVHVWQQLNDLDSLPAEQAEGSAEYASYLLLTDGGTEEGRVKIQAMKESTDAAYGVGFRKALRVASEGLSSARLREVLKRGRGWPGAP